MSDKYDEQATELLPCEEWGHESDDHCAGRQHVVYCAAFHRSVVAAALRAGDPQARAEGYAAAREDAAKAVLRWYRTEGDESAGSLLSGLAEAIRALKPEGETK